MKIATIILTFSFMLFPLLQLKALRFKNKDLFEKAEWLKEHHIQGSFTSNLSDAGQMWVVAYLNHMQFFTIERNDYNEQELTEEMKRYSIDYYIFSAENNVLNKQNPSPNLFEWVAEGNGMVVYKFIPNTIIQ